MKKLLLAAVLLLTGISNAQDVNYSEKWKIIDSLEVRGLVESADSIVVEIIASAEKRKDHLQLIKAKIYHYKFYQINHENSNQFILDDVNAMITCIPAPYKNVLFSYKAIMLEQYYLENRWSSRGRSEIDDPDAGSIETWALNTLQDSIHTAFDNSLQHEKLLISTPAQQIEDLLFSIPLKTLVIFQMG